MRETPIKVLLIEDDPVDASLIRETLARVAAAPIDVHWVDRLAKGLEHLATDGVDVVLLDLSLPDSQGLAPLVRACARAPQVPVLVITNPEDEALAVKAVREGAQDYLVKGQIDGNLLLRAMLYSIERKRAEAELQGYARELATKAKHLDTLATLSRTVSGSLNLEQVLNFVVQATVQLLGVNVSRFWLWDEIAGVLRLAASAGDPGLAEYHPQVLRPGEGMAGRAFQCRENLTTNAPATDPRFVHQDTVHENGICTQAAVPIVVGKSALGVLTAARRNPESFDPDQLILLGSLAAQAAIAIENARLLQETQRYLRREQILTAGVAHEINNPLSVILGFSQLLLKRTDPHSEIYHDLKLIEKQSRACRQIVEDLRHLARPLPLKREAVSVNQLIQETLEPLKHSLASRKVQVSLIPDPHLPLLSADRRLLGQVLLNLITNAADALPEGGTLTITSQVKQKETVEVAVTDTGVGIAPEHMRWIFDPFVTTKPVGKGMGLGLSLAARIVEDHGGRIEVESEVGWGSTFRILLPLLEASDSEIQTIER